MDKEVKMKQKNKKQTFIPLLLLLVISVSVGFAALSTTLIINGSGIMPASKWDIHFANVEVTGNTAQVIKTAEIADDTTYLEYSVKLPKPGSYYSFTVDVVNEGTIDAALSSDGLKLGGITTAQDVYTNYVVTYEDGTEIKAGDVLAAGESVKLNVMVEFEKDLVASQLPTTQQTLDLSVSMFYEQANN